MILLGRLEVFNGSASSSFSFLSVFSYRFLFNGRLSSASFPRQAKSADFNKYLFLLKM